MRTFRAHGVTMDLFRKTRLPSQEEALPGRASSWEGSRVLRKRSIVTPCARKVRIQCGPLPAAVQAEARPFSTAQRCGMQPQAMCSIEVKEKAKRTKTKDNNKKRRE